MGLGMQHTCRRADRVVPSLHSKFTEQDRPKSKVMAMCGLQHTLRCRVCVHRWTAVAMCGCSARCAAGCARADGQLWPCAHPRTEDCTQDCLAQEGPVWTACAASTCVWVPAQTRKGIVCCACAASRAGRMFLRKRARVMRHILGRGPALLAAEGLAMGARIQVRRSGLLRCTHSDCGPAAA